MPDRPIAAEAYISVRENGDVILEIGDAVFVLTLSNACFIGAQLIAGAHYSLVDGEVGAILSAVAEQSNGNVRPC